MPDLPTPSAARLPRARWLDARLLLGVLLVLVAVVVGAKLLAEADDRVPVWGVTRDLGPGSRLTAEDLVQRSARMDGDVRRYVDGAGKAPVGNVLLRAVGEGELLPYAAMAPAHSAGLRRLPIEVDSVAVTGLERGQVVDVYVVPAAQNGEPPPRSRLVLADVTVDEVDGGSAGLGGTQGGAVVLLVDPEQARELLDAQALGTLALLQQRASREAQDAEPAAADRADRADRAGAASRAGT